MAIAAAFDLEIFQYDAVNAFTNSTLDETVYCECPQGFEQSDQCLLLLRALYRLRRSPLLWLKEFSSTLKELGLKEIKSCLFTNDWLVVFFYVDDIIVMYHTKDLLKLYQFKEALFSRYEMRDLGEL